MAKKKGAVIDGAFSFARWVRPGGVFWLQFSGRPTAAFVEEATQATPDRPTPRTQEMRRT
jgi:hypothetical protein